MGTSIKPGRWYGNRGNSKICRFILYLHFLPLALFGQFSAYHALPFPYERPLNGITSAYLAGIERTGWYDHPAALTGLEHRYAALGVAFSRIETSSDFLGDKAGEFIQNNITPGNLFFAFPASFNQRPVVLFADFDGLDQPFDAKPFTKLQSDISRTDYEQSGSVATFRAGAGLQAKDWLALGISLRRFHGDIKFEEGELPLVGFKRRGTYKYRAMDAQVSARLSAGKFYLDGILNFPYTLMTAEHMHIQTANAASEYDASYRVQGSAVVQTGYRFKHNDYLNYAFSYLKGTEFLVQESDYNYTVAYKPRQSHALNAGIRTTFLDLTWNMMAGYFITEHPAVESYAVIWESTETISSVADSKWHDGFIFSFGPEVNRVSLFLSGSYQNDRLYIKSGSLVPPPYS